MAMFTSNGLMCLSGVTICRMLRLAMAVSPYRVVSRRFLRDLVIRADDMDIRALVAGLIDRKGQCACEPCPLQGFHDVAGQRLAGEERETRWSPRALPHPTNSTNLQPGE